MIDKLANAIVKANEGQQAYIGYCEETKKYYGYHGNLVKTKRYAMRLINPDRFIKMGLKPITIK